MDLLIIGDKIVYPNQGLGVVEDIQEEIFYGEKFKIYHVRILSNDTLVIIPSTNVKEIGIRKPIPEDYIEEIFEFMRNGIVDVTMNWKGRYKEHLNLMKSGAILDMALVLKSLFYLNLIKALSFREKKMMEKAKELVVSEISEVTSISLLKIEERVMNNLSLCFKDVNQELNS